MALKDLFIKPDGVEQPTAEVKAAPSVSGAPKSFTAVSATKEENVTAVKQPSMDVKPTVMQSSITADEVIVNKVWDKIIAANRPGPDYLELKNNVEALEDLPISNEQKLISAFKVLRKVTHSSKKMTLRVLLTSMLRLLKMRRLQAWRSWRSCVFRM